MSNSTHEPQPKNLPILKIVAFIMAVIIGFAGLATIKADSVDAQGPLPPVVIDITLDSCSRTGKVYTCQVTDMENDIHDDHMRRTFSIETVKFSTGKRWQQNHNGVMWVAERESADGRPCAHDYKKKYAPSIIVNVPELDIISDIAGNTWSNPHASGTLY